jgi:hypothetical protein
MRVRDSDQEPRGLVRHQQARLGGRTILVTETTADKKLGTTLINNPLSNGNPNNVTFATQNYNPNGKGGTGDAHPLEMSYPNPGSMIFKETLNNADFTTPPLHASFNLLIFSS